MLKRFLCSYFALCVIPFLLLGVLVANISQETIQKELLNAAEISMDESYRSITNLIDNTRIVGSVGSQFNAKFFACIIL